MKVYVYNKCSTCKSALQFLKKNAIEFDQTEIDLTPPTKDELEQMLSFNDGDLRKLFNTSGALYKEMELSRKMPSLTLREAFDLLTKFGMLVKRPFLIDKKIGIVGFNETKWKDLLLNE